MTPTPHPILTTEDTEKKTNREHREKIILFYPTHNPKDILTQRHKDHQEKIREIEKQENREIGN